LFIYFSICVEGSLPVLGELSEEEEVLQWLITQKTEERIELITRVMLEGLVEETQYLAVYFCKYIIETATCAVFYFKNMWDVSPNIWRDKDINS
jgi:hypothetical protein